MINSIRKSLITVFLLGLLLFLSLLSFASTNSGSIKYVEDQGILIPVKHEKGLSIEVHRSSNSSESKYINTQSVSKEFVVDSNPRRGVNFYKVNYVSAEGELVKEDNYAVYVPAEGSLKIDYRLTDEDASIRIKNLENKPYSEYITLEVVGDNLEIIDYDLARLPEKDEEIELPVTELEQIRSLRVYKNNFLISNKNIK